MHRRCDIGGADNGQWAATGLNVTSTSDASDRLLLWPPCARLAPAHRAAPYAHSPRLRSFSARRPIDTMIAFYYPPFACLASRHRTAPSVARSPVRSLLRTTPPGWACGGALTRNASGLFSRQKMAGTKVKQAPFAFDVGATSSPRSPDPRPRRAWSSWLGDTRAHQGHVRMPLLLLHLLSRNSSFPRSAQTPTRRRWACRQTTSPPLPRREGHGGGSRRPRQRRPKGNAE